MHQDLFTSLSGGNASRLLQEELEWEKVLRKIIKQYQNDQLSLKFDLREYFSTGQKQLESLEMLVWELVERFDVYILRFFSDVQIAVWKTTETGRWCLDI